MPIAYGALTPAQGTAQTAPIYTAGGAAQSVAASAGDAAQASAASAGAAAQSQGATAQEQLSGILNKGGALMQQSATMGNQQAASRGLLNSSMGIQAAQNAMIQNASPIAQNDANLIQNNQQWNAGAQNQQNQYNASNVQQANQWNAGAQNQNDQYNASNQQQTSQWNAGAQNQQNQWNAQAQNQGSQFNSQQSNAMNQWNAGQQNELMNKITDINSREQLMNMEANYKTLMQANSSASSLWEQTLKNMSDIQSSDKLDAGSKQAALDNQMNSLRYGMTMLQNMNGITGLVTF